MTQIEMMVLNEYLQRSLQILAGNHKKESTLYALLQEAQEELRKERRKSEVVS